MTPLIAVSAAEVVEAVSPMPKSIADVNPPSSISKWLDLTSRSLKGRTRTSTRMFAGAAISAEVDIVSVRAIGELQDSVWCSEDRL